MIDATFALVRKDWVFHRPNQKQPHFPLPPTRVTQIELQDQPYQLLLKLLEHAGQAGNRQTTVSLVASRQICGLRDRPEYDR
jgi:hypothetical protein